MNRHWASTAVLLPLLYGPLLAQGPLDRPGVSEVRTVGTAQRSLRPDLAVVTLSFSAVGGSPREAGQRVAARADSLRGALQKLGIPRDSLVTGSRWHWWGGRLEILPGPTRHIPPPPGTSGPTLTQQDTAYRAHEVVEVRVRDLAKVGAVIDAALGLNITQISDIRFTATKTGTAREDALREATASARREAMIVAESSGGKLGRILSLSTDTSPQSHEGGALSVQGSMARPRTEVVEPQIPLTVTVYGRWELVSSP